MSDSRGSRIDTIRDIVNYRYNNIPDWQRHMLIVYVQFSLVELYKQWVADGKKIPVEEVIQLSNCLICKGIDGFRSPAIGWRK